MTDQPRKGGIKGHSKRVQVRTKEKGLHAAAQGAALTDSFLSDNLTQVVESQDDLNTKSPSQMSLLPPDPMGRSALNEQEEVKKQAKSMQSAVKEKPEWAAGAKRGAARQGTDRLSSSGDESSPHGVSPWLRPVVTMDGEDGTDQSLLPRRDAPHLVNIKINEEALRVPAASDSSAIQSQHKTDSLQTQSKRTGGGDTNPSLALQINSIKNTLQGSVSGQPERALIPKSFTLLVEGTVAKPAQRAMVGGKAPRNAFASSVGQKAAPQFLQTERFLQISQKQQLVNKEAIQARSKQLQSLSYRPQDLNSNVQGKTPRGVAGKQLQMRTPAAKPQYSGSSYEHKDTLINLEKVKPATDSDGQLIQQPQVEASYASGFEQQEHRSLPGLAEPASQLLPSVEEVGSVQASVEAAVYVPDVIITQRASKQSLPSHRETASMSKRGIPLNAIHRRQGSYQLQQVQPSMSEVTSGSNSSVHSRTHREHVIRNQTLFLSTRSDQGSKNLPQQTSKAKLGQNMRQQTMHRTKQNPAIMGQFMEKFGESHQRLGSPHDSATFFSARENSGKLKVAPMLGSVRPKTTERRGAQFAKSYDPSRTPRQGASVSTQNFLFRNGDMGKMGKNTSLPAKVDMKRRYTAQRSRRNQMCAQNKDSQLQQAVVAGTSRNISNWEEPGSKYASQSLTDRRLKPSDDAETLANTTARNEKAEVVGVFQEKPTLKFDPSVYSSQKINSGSNNRFSIHLAAADSVASQRQSLRKLSMASGGFAQHNENTRLHSWDERRAIDLNYMHERFSAQGIENMNIKTKQQNPKSYVKVPEILRSQQQLESHYSAGFHSLGSSENPNPLHSQFQLAQSQANDTVKIGVIDLKAIRRVPEDFAILKSDRTHRVSTGYGPEESQLTPAQITLEPRLAASEYVGAYSIIEDQVSSSLQAEPLQTDFREDSGPSKRITIKNFDGLVEEGLLTTHNRTTDDNQPLTLSQMVPDEGPTNYWDERGFPQANLESDSVENISSVQRAEYDTSIHDTGEDQHKQLASQDVTPKVKKVKSETHQLQSRANGEILPLSVDLVPNNVYEKAIHKLHNKRDFDNVVAISIREVNEENFVSQLHGLEVAKMDRLLARSQKPSDDTTSKADGSTSVTGTEKEADYDKKSEASKSESIALSVDSTLMTPKMPIQLYVPPKARIKVKNSLFQLPDRPSVLDVLFKDLISVYEPDEEVDIFAYKSEDYLDEIRLLTEEEDNAFEVRFAFGLMTRWVQYIRPPAPLQVKSRRGKRSKQSSGAQAAVLSITEASAMKDNLDQNQGTGATDEDDAGTVKANFKKRVKALALKELVELGLSNTRPTAQPQPCGAIADAQVSEVKAARAPIGAVSTQKETSQNSESHQDVKDVANRRVLLELYARSQTRVSVKLEVDFEGILKLQRKVEAYGQRRIQNVLPLVIFDDFEEECISLQKEIVRRRIGLLQPVRCVVTMKDHREKRYQQEGEVLDYLRHNQMFIVQVEEKRYLMPRLCIQFDDLEVRAEVEDRRVAAMQVSKQVLLRINIERILFEEVLKLRPELRQPGYITNGIEERVGLARMTRLTGMVFGERELNPLVQQFESLYCFSMMKSIVMSEAEDENPSYACLITGYKVEHSEHHATPFFGLQSFQRNKGPINHLINKKDCVEHLGSRSLLGRACFQKAFKFIIAQTQDILDKQSVFQMPPSEKTAHSLILNRKFKRLFGKPENIIKQMSIYPQKTLDMAVLQKVTALNFHKIAVSIWQDGIITYIKKLILDNFSGSKKSFFTKDVSSISPYVVRFFKSIYQLQVNLLYAKYEQELKNYLEFLLRFANFSPSLRQKQGYFDIGLDKFEVEYSQKCFIEAKVQIKLVQAAQQRKVQETEQNQMYNSVFKDTMRRLRPQHPTQKLESKPMLEDIYTQLFKMLNSISAQFVGIPTVHHVIYKYANLGNKTIIVSQDLEGRNLGQQKETEETVQSALDTMGDDVSQADPNNLQSKDQVHVLRMQIEYLMTDVVEQVNSKLVDLRPYVKYLGYNFEDILFDLRSLIFQQATEVQVKAEEDEFQAALNQADSEQITDQEFIDLIKKTEILESTYRYQYKELVDAYWKVQIDVEDVYNFGLVGLDCRGFKQQAVEGLGKLIEQLRQHLLKDFTDSLSEWTKKNEETWDRVQADHIDIDLTLEQIEYVNQMRQEDVNDDMINFVRNLSQKKRFLDELQVAVPEKEFIGFLNLHSFPQLLQKELKKKQKILKIEAKRIAKQIQLHARKTREQLMTFAERFKVFSKVVLPTRQEFQARMNQPGNNAGYIYNTLQRLEADGLALKDEDPVWDSQMIEAQTNKIQELNKELALVEEDTRIINRRQEILQLKPSDFPEHSRLKRGIKPLVQLWETIQQYNQMIDDWKDQPVSRMTLDEVEDFCTEWHRKLLGVLKDDNLKNLPGPPQIASYILGDIEHLREFVPLLQALRVKGLDRRHLAQINKEIGEDLHLHKINFRWLYGKDFHKGNKFSTIKGISDTASKEHTIRVTIEQVEAEVKNTKLTAVKYKDSLILKNMSRDMTNFSECDLKITSIAHNPYAKIFRERIDLIQADLKRIMNFFAIWADLQKYWAYLLPIFAQKDIALHLPEQYEKFVITDKLYRHEVQSANSKEGTYKEFSKGESLRQHVPAMMQQFEYLMKCLIKYLETKREYFPRLYFLSNEQIIEIVGMMEDMTALEQNLFKMFEGFDKLIIDYENEESDDELSISSFGDENAGTKKKRIWRAQDTKLFKQAFKTCLGTRPVRDVTNLGRIRGVQNQQGEPLAFERSIKITNAIEEWLKRVEYSMKFSVAQTLQQCLYSFYESEFLDWVRYQNWPTQFLITVLEIDLTRQLKKIFDDEIQIRAFKASQVKHKNAMAQWHVGGRESFRIQEPLTYDLTKDTPAQRFRQVYASIMDQIAQLTLVIREQLSSCARESMSSLIINRVHCRDILRNMIHQGVEKSTDFLWNIHMRYNCRDQDQRKTQREYDKEQEESSEVSHDPLTFLEAGRNNKKKRSNKSQTPEQNFTHESKEKQALYRLSIQYYPCCLDLQMVEAVQPYGYEFLPNLSRLVISPLTERCFQSLFLALHFMYGGAPIGPAGTGKTESIKELSKNIARNCFVFNCQGTIDYTSMSKFFKGLAANGTWVCFDEFNRLQIQVLSILSQLIVSLMNAKHDQKSEITIEGTTLAFDLSCGLFITMNPYHRGRTPLPDNLKALFRQVNMVVPDILFIAEILLYSVGFQEARNLAFKITRTFDLLQEQLRFEKHYDFGLRCIKQVLIYAGSIKLRSAKVASKANIQSDRAKDQVSEHLASFSRIKRQKTLREPKNSAANQRRTLIAQIRNQEKFDESESPKSPSSRKNASRQLAKQQSVDSGSLEDFDSSLGLAQGSQSLGLDSVQNETILEESSMGSDESVSDDGGSSTEERIKVMIEGQVQNNEEEEGQGTQEPSEDEESNPVEQVDHDFINELNALGLDHDYLVHELGCENKKVILNVDLLDQFIVLKSIVDKNLPKLLFKDISILYNSCADVFPNIPSSQLMNRNHVIDTIEIRLEKRGLYRGSDFVQNIYNIYEALTSRHGIMVLGQPTSGKTTCIRMLQDVLNTLHYKEWHGKLRQFQKAKAKRLGIKTRLFKGQLVPKEKDPQLEKDFAPKEHEKKLVLATCKFKGVSNFTINPKSVSMAQLMGYFDETSREWTDGVLSHGIRSAANDTTSRHMIVCCDGQIEPDWVENLNSVLDDNKRLSLITGETIYLTPVMNVLLEASNLIHCTPATISRCAICYVRRETLPAKAQFNHWLSSLPAVLWDQRSRIDMYVNYFVTEIFVRFLVPEKLLYPVTQSWAIINFSMIYDSLIEQYRGEKYKDEKSIRKVNEKMAREKKMEENNRQLGLKNKTLLIDRLKIQISGNNVGQKVKAAANKELEQSAELLQEDDSVSLSKEEQEESKESVNSKMDTYSHNLGGEAVQNSRNEATGERQNLQNQRSAQSDGYEELAAQKELFARSATLQAQPSRNLPPEPQTNTANKARPPEHNFSDSDLLFESSIRNKNYWMDAFFLYSLTWAFGSLLNQEGRSEFNLWLLTVLRENDAVKARKRQNKNKQDDDKDNNSNSSQSKSDNESLATQEYEATHEFVIGQVEHMEVSLPTQEDMFDLYFDVQDNSFKSWSAVFCYLQEERSVGRPKKNPLSVTVTTTDYLKIDYLFDRLLDVKKPVLILGPTGHGKSTFIRNYVYEKESEQRRLRYDLSGCSYATTAPKMLALLEGQLVKQAKTVMQPKDGFLTYFIDDIHMSQKDKWDVQCANELVRQHIDYGGWYNHDKVYFKKVKNISFVSSISTRQANKELIDERLGWHFVAVGIINSKGCHIEQIYKTALARTFIHSPTLASIDMPQKVLDASIEFYHTYEGMVTPAPTSFLFRINNRHLVFLLKGIIDVPNSYYKNVGSVAQVWANEVSRTILDRYTDPLEHERLYNVVKDIASRTFGAESSIFPENCQINQFFYGQPESETSYNPIMGEKKLIQLLQETIVEYNKSNPQEQISVIIFDSIIEKTLKIARSVLMPFANTILIADRGAGANELCKMATRLVRTSHNQLFANDSEQLEDWRGHLRSLMMREALEARARAVLHLVERDFVPGVLETIEGLAAHGELFQLFTQEEYENLLMECRVKAVTTNHRGRALSAAQSLEEVREQIHHNMHCLLQLTPRSEVLLMGLRDAPHLLSSSTLIYFGEWSDPGYEFIARKHLADSEDEAMPFALRNPEFLCRVMIEMYHDAVAAGQLYHQETDHFVYISPRLFDMFVQTFKRLYHRRGLKLLRHRERFARGLEGIRRTQEYTERKQDELALKSPELVEKQRALESLIDELGVRKGQVQKQIQLMLQIEDEASFALNETKMIQAECDKRMREATPVFKDALEGLLKISKKEIDELRAIRRPLQSIMALLEAVCLILGAEPKIVRDQSSNFKPVKCYWTTALSSQVLGDRNLVQRMTQIDPTQIEDATIHRLEALLEKGDLSPEKMATATRATKGFYSWVMAVRNYFYVYRTSEPLRDKLIIADLQMQNYETRKEENKSRLDELEQNLAHLKDVHQKKEEEIKDFQREIEEVFILKSKSARLLNELAGEKQKWLVCEEVAAAYIQTLEGDSLVAAAMVCFLAPFTQQTRDRLYAKWLTKIADGSIDITARLNFNTVFTDPLKIKGWLDNGLPNDSYSIQNAIILKNAQLQPILIDPQTQGNKWLRKELKEVQVLNMQTSRFLKELQLCIKLGSTVLLENVDDSISRRLYPLFLFERARKMGNQRLNMQIMMDSTVTQIDPSFRMYITSVHPTPDFGADLSLLANFINFSVTLEAFEAQILALLFAELETEQDAKHRIYRRQALVWIRRLKGIEDEILEELTDDKPQDSLILDDFLIEKLLESRNVTKQTGKTLLEIQNSMKLLMETSKLYRPVSARAAKFFFVANDLVKLNNMYQFTHEWFIGFFGDLVRKTIIDDDTERKKKEAIRKLRHEFTWLFYTRVCQALFDCDKLLFSFLLAYKELEVEFRIDQRQVEFFIKGGLQQEDEIFDAKESFERAMAGDEGVQERLKRGEQIANRRKKACPWIDATQWKAIDKLSRIPPFDQPNLRNKEACLADHIEKHSQEWHDFVTGAQIIDYTMARFAPKDSSGGSEEHSSEEGKASQNSETGEGPRGSIDSSKQGPSRSRESNERSDESLADSVSLASDSELLADRDSDDEEEEPGEKSDERKERERQARSKRKANQNLVEQVNDDQFVDLGVPGGYEKFNYEDAIRRGAIALQLEAEVKQRLVDGLRKVMTQGRSIEETREQRELDDIFAMDGQPSKHETSSRLSRASRGETASQGESAAELEDAEDAFEDFRQNNVEEDTRIALAIIQGIAEYAEFRVSKQKKLSKRQTMRQYVISSHMVRLCLMRCFHPERLYQEIKSFIAYFLGRGFKEPPPFEFSALYEKTSKAVPILLMAGPNVNAYTELSAFKLLPAVPTGTTLVYQPLGQMPNEKIARVIIKCACEGSWLLLDNLQLALEITANLQKFLETMYLKGRELKESLLHAAKVELRSQYSDGRVFAKEAAPGEEQDSNIAVELMLLEQSLNNDSLETTFNPDHNKDASLSEATTANRSQSVDAALQSSLKAIHTRKKSEARADTMRTLDRLERERKEANVRCEVRELTAEEKSLQELVYPEKLAFPIHKRFRLWISAIPVPHFPASFARRSLKVSLELPTNIRPNAIKSFSSIAPRDIADVHTNARDFKRLLFSLTVMHAVINHRESFGPFGWTQPYHFSPNDLQISIRMLAEVARKTATGQNLPLKLLRYLVGDLNYGGKLTNKEDKRILTHQVKTFIHRRVYDNSSNALPDVAARRRSLYLDGRGKQPRPSLVDATSPDSPYDLTGCQFDYARKPNEAGDRAFFVQEEDNEVRSYLMPASVHTLRDMKEHVQQHFPLEDCAEIFGLHKQATMKAAADLASTIMYRTYIYQFVIKRPQQPALTRVQHNRRDTMIYEYFRARLKEILYLVPPQVKAEEYEDQIPVEREKPFNALLTKEIQQYNKLIDEIKWNLENTLAAMDGHRQHDSSTESTFDCLQQERTPPAWVAYSYPCSPSIIRFIANLTERMNYIRSLLAIAISDQFYVRRFWFAGFFNQRSFLTTLMQDVARRQRISIEELTISFRVMRANEEEYPHRKAEMSNSFYIDGLWLYGAVWDEQQQTILDLPPMAELGSRLPPLHLKIDRQELSKPEDGQGEDFAAECLTTEEYQQQLYRDTHYLCPLYVSYDQVRSDGSQSVDGQFITYIPLPVKSQKPTFWIKRNISILCYNDQATD